MATDPEWRPWSRGPHVRWNAAHAGAGAGCERSHTRRRPEGSTVAIAGTNSAPGARRDRNLLLRRPQLPGRERRPRRTARPGVAPVWRPSFTTATPFTRTWRTPVA